MLRKDVPETIDEYTEDLRRRLIGILPEEKIDEAVAEAESHLQESAEALRQEADLYEKQAVARFLSSGSMARGLSRAWAATYLRHAGTKWLQALGLSVSILGTVLLLEYFSFRARIEPVLLFWFPLPVFLIAALACRWQLRRYIVVGLTVITLSFLWGGWKFTDRVDALAVSRFRAPRRLVSERAYLQKRIQNSHLIQTGNVFLGRGIVELSTKKKYADVQKNILVLQKKILDADFNRENRLDSKSMDRYFSAMRSYNKEMMSLQKEKMLLMNQISLTLKKRSIYKAVAEYRRANDRPLQGKTIEALDRQNMSLIQTLPTVLRVGNRIRVPIEMSPEEKEWFPMDPQFETTDRLSIAVKRWGQLDDAMLDKMQIRTTQSIGRVTALEAFINASRCQFEMGAARFLATFIAAYVGVLLLADLVGGWLGGLILRTFRRRRVYGNKRLKS